MREPRVVVKGSYLAVLLLIGAHSAIGCAVVRPGERGVKRTFGKLGTEIHSPGIVFYNPFSTRVVRLPVRSTSIEAKLNLPSREGLTIRSEISILYRIIPEHVPSIIETVGLRYEDTLILTTFRSAAAGVTSNHLAKEMHSSRRAAIEREIASAMNKRLNQRGFLVEAVLLKSIILPQGLARSIEQKLQAEQDAERMKFVLTRQKLEAERQLTEARGIRDAQRVIAEGITPPLLKWRAIEAFRQLATSPNAKVIITDGKTPLLPPTE